MSIVFNGLETNKVLWNGIETSGYLNGTIIWGKIEPPILLTPMTTFAWPSMSNGCFTINGNTVTCRGVNGFKELLYKTFTVEESGDYTLELDWTSPTGLTLAAPNDDYWNRFGLYIDTSLRINYDGGYQGAMSQGIIMQRSNDTSVITKSQSTTVSLTANTTYYIWLSYSILADNRNQTIEFTKLQLVKQF